MMRTSAPRRTRTILEGVRRDRAKILIGGDASVIDVTQRVLGSRYQGLVSRAARRAEERRERS